MTSRILWIVCLLAGCARQATPGMQAPAAAGARGEELYATFCAVCHGADGRGSGAAAPFNRVPPADFTRAEFKFRSTPPGSLPTDGDLDTVIRAGSGGDGMMPAFPFLAAEDRRALVAKVKSFSPRWLHERQPTEAAMPPAAGDAEQRPAPVPAHAPVDASTVISYWRPPLHAGQAGVAAATCAACHPQQFADWSRSRHALAMGPGVWAQIQEQGGDCVRCHAPLAEQAEDAFLLADGISCAACHVRGGQTFGPSPTPSTLLPLVSGLQSIHGKIETRQFFEEPEFCSGCHHFPPGTAPLVAGTTLQNTYEEWRKSQASREGQTCQTCHMPDRRHLFRGIHDPETVRRAVQWTFDVAPRAARVKARMTLTNTGAGHHLPTYVVPEIWMRIEVMDGAGATLAVAEHRIARKVTSENGAWTQTSDTRLAPGETATLEYTAPMPRTATVIVGRVIVLPDRWQADKFRVRVAEAQSDAVRRYYQAALEETDASGYTLFEEWRRVER